MEQAPSPPGFAPQMSASLPRLAALLVLAAASCVPAASAARDPAAGPLPPYGAAEAALLDDRLGAEVFGALVDTSEPTGRRAALADGIVRARVTTLTADNSGGSESYSLELAPVGDALKGPSVNERLVLSIRVTNPSFAALKASADELVGKSVIVLYKHFNESGQASLRWHIEADNERVLRAIEQARLLGAFGR